MDTESLVTYEQPLNERIRTLLRLEQLSNQLTASLQRQTIWDNRNTFCNLVDTLEILGRTDLKTEIIKELERHQQTLSRLLNSKEVDQVRLDTILGKLEECRHYLHQSAHPLGQSLRQIELLNSLAQKASIVGSICSFDLPVYQHWLQRPAEQRQAQLLDWFGTLKPVTHAVRLLLEIIRESTTLQTKTAESGFYQQTLDNNIPYQLLRVSIPADAKSYPEISAGKHRFTVRFMVPRLQERALQTNEDIEFLLACCAL